MLCWPGSLWNMSSESLKPPRRDQNSASSLTVVVAAAVLSVAIALIVNWQHLDGFANELCFAVAPTQSAP